MWPFSTRKSKARKLAMDKACALISSQIQAASGIDGFFEKSQNLWALGYSFGMLQASLEADDLKTNFTQSEYREHIGTGLGIVYANDALGVVYFHVGLSSMGNDQFESGQYAGGSEYLRVIQDNAEARELHRYLKTAKFEPSIFRRGS